jgi:WD40 repeat protein
MRDGQAATADSGTNPPARVDLSTGERSYPEFTLEDGTSQRPWAVVPDGAALWTLTPLGQAARITRWENGTPVSSVDLPGRPAPGELFGDRWAILVEVPGGQLTPHLIALDPDGPSIVMSVEVPDSGFAIPSVDGGVHVLDVDGTMFTFDRAGDLVGEIETGLRDVWAAAVDPASGRVAIASSIVGVAIVDPRTDDVQEPTTTDVIVNLGFARDGQYLALTSRDGTVRLWDVERQTSAGLVWDGSGARILTNSWYDETSDSIWITTSGRLIEVPLDPEVWVERACAVVGRDFTDDEWDRLVPGDGPRRSACE